MNRIKLLKTLDGIIGTPLVFLFSMIRCWKNIPSQIKKILLIRPGGIGDAVLLLPAVDALKSRFPDSDIDVLCEKRNAEIFGLSENISRIYFYDRGLDLFRCLRNKYDVVIDTEQWHRLSAIVAYISLSPVRIGFDTNERAKLFTHGIQYSHDDYEVNSFLNLIRPLVEDVPVFEIDKPLINISDVSSEFLERFSLNRDSQFVAIFPGASVRERRWGGEKFGKVAGTLIKSGYKIVVLGSDDDKSDADIIKGYANDCINLIGKTTLTDVAAILKISRLLITADSGVMHIAYAVGTPTVSFFGSGIERKWAPRGIRHIILNKHLECSPCTKFGYTPGCKKNAECLSLISVDDVVEAAGKILSNKD